MAYTNIGWQIIEKLYTLISAEFSTAKVYKADILNIPIHSYKDTGTFCIEIMRGPDYDSDGSPTGQIQDNYTFNVWIYLRYKDNEEGQENLTNLTEHLVTFLHSWAQVQVTDLWFDAEPVSVEYGQKAKVTEKTITYLRAALVSWGCRVLRQREE